MSEESEKKPNPFKELRHLNILYVFGITIIANTFVGGAIGYFLDKYTFKNRVLLVIFLVLGIASGLYQGILGLLKEAREMESAKAEPKAENDRPKNKGAP